MPSTSTRTMANQPSLFGDEPPVIAAASPGARTTDPATSHKAARVAESAFGVFVYQTLWLYAGAGETDEDAWKRSAELGQWRQGTVAKRRHRAMVAGLVEDTGQTRVLDSGLEGKVWRLTEAGRLAYEAWLVKGGDPRAGGQ